MLRIRPDGSVSDAMLVSSLPDVDYGRQTKPVGESMKFNEVPSDCRMRWPMAPINIEIPTARLR